MIQEGCRSTTPQLLDAQSLPSAEMKRPVPQHQLLDLLLQASREGHNQAVLYLLDNGANPFGQDAALFNGETAVITAARNGHADCVAICCLSRENCDFEQGLRLGDNQNSTAWHWAVRGQHVKVLSVLLQLAPERYLLALEAVVQGSGHALASSNEFKAFVKMHYPSVSASASAWGTELDKDKLNPPAQARSADILKHWGYKLSTWYIMESYLIGTAPYLCQFSLVVGFLHSLQFMWHREMWIPTWKMAPLHAINMLSQALLWYLVRFTRNKHPGMIEIADDLSSYDRVLQRIVTSTRADVSAAATAATVASSQLAATAAALPLASADLPRVLTSSSCCHFCRIWKNEHEHDGHSPVTHQCIPEYDHFCVYLGQDIGRDNYGPFFAALGLMAVIILPIYLSLSVMYIGHHFVGGYTLSTYSMVYRRFLDFFLAWTFLSEAQMLLFFIFHVVSVTIGLTTREVSKRRKGGKATRPIYSSSSFYQNWRKRLFPTSRKAKSRGTLAGDEHQV